MTALPTHNMTSESNIIDADINPFHLSPDYAYKARRLKVFTIGAGFSGLLMAHKLQHRFPDLKDIVQHTIFEARSEIGGTWFVNNYPGVQCDVPAHIYVRLFLCHLVDHPNRVLTDCMLCRRFPLTQTQIGNASTLVVPKSWII